ncbi:MAG: hypothetical protein U1E65_00630 [Myxococcota bacterium]
MARRSGGATLVQDLVSAIKDAKAGYDRENKYSKMRIWIFGVFGADVVATLLWVFLIAGPSLNVTAWYEEGFPSNLVVIQNNGRSLSDVSVLMDGKFSAEIEELEHGATGLEIDRQFRGASDTAPERTYKPTTLEIRSGGNRVQLRLTGKK